MEFIINYGLFLAKIATIVVALLIIIAVISALGSKAKEHGKLLITKLNKKYDEMAYFINSEILSKKAFKSAQRFEKKKSKMESEKLKNRIFVLNFEGDIKASAVTNLREEITAVLLTAQPLDEILVRLESPGGVVNGYGLAASQLQRIKDARIKLTVAVDKVAASGGYMMACVADRIIAAPFSIIGSIGVVAQLPNFHRFLKKHSIDFEQITAGQYKRTLSLFGENTEQGRTKVREEVDDAQQLFKSFIQEHRPHIDIEKVATGEHWFGSTALDLNLIDELKTSDDFLLQAKDRFDIYEVRYKIKKPINQRLGLAFYNLLEYFRHGA